ncbi:MAG: hypothetical protein CL891_02425 [Dehalococcoidia bacterium]|nr:hypothetical protein [Dehalococcoidia bacterium]
MDEGGLGLGIILAISTLGFAYASLNETAKNTCSKEKSGSQPSSHLLTLFLVSLIVASATAISISLSDSPRLFFIIICLFIPLCLRLIFLVTTWVAVNFPRYTSGILSPVSIIESLLQQAYRRISPGRTDGNRSDHNGKGLNDLGQGETETIISPEEEADLDERERSMIRSILRLDEYNARDIMIPRMDIKAIDMTEGVQLAANVMLESGHSRLPIYEETIDHITGVLHARDLLPLLNSKKKLPSLKQIARAPFFVPESKRLDELLTEFQKRRVHMAFVVDEHGGTEGLVTLEDLLEEIVGEIEDEFSTVFEPQIQTNKKGELIIDARVSLHEVAELISFDSNLSDVDTIGGIVYTQLGRVPQTGDEVEYAGITIKVLSTIGRRLGKLKVVYTPTE